MAITYPLTIPMTPASVTFRPMQVALVSQSPYSGNQQVQERTGGQWWEFRAEYKSHSRSVIAPMAATLAALKGAVGTFYIGPVGDEATPRGVATGTPLVKGAGQAALQDVATDGWTAGVTGILKAGDYIQIGTSLYIVLQDANSDESGNSTISIFPRLRNGTADNAPIITTNPKGIFRLTSQTEFSQTQRGLFTVASIEGIEAI